MTKTEFRNCINSHFSVVDIIRNFVTDDFEEHNIGNNKRLHPCPLTNNENNSFALKRDENGFEVYYMFNSDFYDDRFLSIPISGTAYDLLRGLFPKDNEMELIVKLAEKNHKSDVKLPVLKKAYNKEPMEFVNQEVLVDLQIKYIQLLKVAPHVLDYLIEERKFEIETITHFGIGYDGVKKVYTYPCFVDGKVKHFRYKNKNITYSLPNNSGGYWFFNEDAINNNTILFVEGEHDVMMIWQKLKIEAVAICGKVSEATLRFKKIKDLRNKNIYLAFDNDKAGREYTDFFQNVFSENNIVKVVDYEGKDPDECLKNGGRFEL